MRSCMFGGATITTHVATTFVVGGIVLSGAVGVFFEEFSPHDTRTIVRMRGIAIRERIE